jgi:hypothetical protein
MKNHIYLVLLLLVISGCRTNEAIEEDKFVEVYADLLIAGDTLSIRDAKQEVFTRYNVDERSYNNTVEHYSSNPLEWEILFNKVIAHIEQRRKETFSTP